MPLVEVTGITGRTAKEAAPRKFKVLLLELAKMLRFDIKQYQFDNGTATFLVPSESGAHELVKKMEQTKFSVRILDPMEEFMKKNSS